MRIRETIVRAGFLSIFSAALLLSNEAKAQTTPTVPVEPIARRDNNWGIVSNVTMVLSVATVTLMPRVYYNDPEATVGWKGRWHISVLAPAMTLTAATMLVNHALKDAIKGPRPNCTVDNTNKFFGNTGCESFGMPSTHSFASWGAAGTGFGIFMVDTLRYSNAKFHVGAFIGNVAVPVLASVFTSVGRGIGPSTNEFNQTKYAFETPEQVIAGTISGFVTGALVGIGYAFLQRPNCGYGNNIICW